MPELHLNPLEARVLGALVEKDITTPEYYPLSLNALVNACNQKSNREPYMSVDADAVRLALRGLSDKGLAGGAHGGEARVPKFRHLLPDRFNLTRPQTAVFCELLLRGPQTVGELRGRAERMHRFDDLEQVQTVLQQLIEFSPPLAQQVPRPPGGKEVRYAHRLSGAVEVVAIASERPAPVIFLENDRVDRLEEKVAALADEVAALRRELTSRREPD